MRRPNVVLVALAIGFCACSARAEAKPFGPGGKLDQFVGDYQGTFKPADGSAVEAFGTVAIFRGTYEVRLFATKYPGVATKGPTAELRAKAGGKAKALKIAGGRGGRSWTGQIADGKLAAAGSGKGGGTFELTYLVRKSPTDLAKPPTGAIVLLPYEPGKKTSLEKWRNKKWKILDDGSVQVAGGSNYTIRKFKDFRMHLEFQQPYQPSGGKGRGNSGVYVLDRYEIQIMDSFGSRGGTGGCAAVYRVEAPKVNASFPPLSWQTYEITFRAARYGADKKITEYPRISVVHNGVKVHENFELRTATGNAKSRGHTASGPIHLQDHHNPVRFRNIWLVERTR